MNRIESGQTRFQCQRDLLSPSSAKMYVSVVSGARWTLSRRRHSCMPSSRRASTTATQSSPRLPRQPPGWRPSMVDWGVACLLAANYGPKSVARTMDAANCAAVLLSVPINYHFHGCTALLVALVVVSGAILNTHLYPFLPTGYNECWILLAESSVTPGSSTPVSRDWCTMSYTGWTSLSESVTSWAYWLTGVYSAKRQCTSPTVVSK